MRYARHVLRALLALSSVGASAQPIAGWTMTARIVVDSGRGPSPAMTVKMEATSDRLRMGFGVAAPSPMADMYVLIDGNSGTMTSVMPAMRSANVMNIWEMTTGLTPMVKTALKGEPTIDVEDRGPGESILAQPTHRYHAHIVYTSSTTMGDFTCEKTVTTDEDVWMSTDLAFSTNLRKALGDVFGGGYSAMAATKLRDAILLKMPGIEMRRLGTTTNRWPGGGSETLTVTSELTELTAGPIEPSRLVPPGDFELLDLRAMMANFDPAMIAGAMSDVARHALCGGNPGGF